MSAHLSFDQAPPISVPLRFFLTAPLFGIAAGLLLAIDGGETLANRGHPFTLGLTHLIAAGFLLQVMAGALFQFVPVVTGGNVRRPQLVASLVHLGLSLGTPLLATAFFTLRPALFTAAVSLLAPALLILVTIVGLALIGANAQGDTLRALRAAVLSLLPTALLGATLALTLSGLIVSPVAKVLEAHQAWALGGWALTLLAGVSWSVVPMFQITPPYPTALTRTFVPAMLTGLGLLSMGLLSMELLVSAPWADGLLLLGKALLLADAAAFAAMTLNLQARAKRKNSDSTRLFFRVAMICLLSFCVVGALLLATGGSTMTELPVALGILLLLGVFGAAVCGMLYKIVPFLVWLHLRSQLPKGVIPPNVNRMIPPVRTQRQFWLYLLSLALLLPSPWLPLAARAGGLCLALSCGLLLVNLVGPVRIYRQHLRQHHNQLISQNCADGERPES